MCSTCVRVVPAPAPQTSGIPVKVNVTRPSPLIPTRSTKGPEHEPEDCAAEGRHRHHGSFLCGAETEVVRDLRAEHWRERSNHERHVEMHERGHQAQKVTGAVERGNLHADKQPIDCRSRQREREDGFVGIVSGWTRGRVGCRDGLPR